MELIDLALQISLAPKRVASTHGGEYHSACPKCGGKDRFFMQPHRKMKNCLGYYCCRQCESSGDTIQFGMDFCGMTFPETIKYLGLSELPNKSFLFKLSKVDRQIEPVTFKPVQLVRPTQKWVERATSFVEEAHENILKHKVALRCLSDRGLPIEAVKRYKIGYNVKLRSDKFCHWGLDAADERFIWLPKGFVLVTTDENGNVLRIKIRRTGWIEGDRYPKFAIVPGGANGFGVVGDVKNKIMFVVEAELDGYAIHNVVGDIAFVVVVGGSVKSPDNFVNYLAETVSGLLVVHDNDDAGLKMLEKWQQIYSHAKACPTPYGKDIGEAIGKGLDLKSWLLGKIAD